MAGDESGTAPEDRKFRPDVQGLRAVAVLLVVLYHSGATFFSGGYVGVDVFFVISGFVITGVLLRERASSGRTSILAFYGRRCRRIIPAATLVIIVAVAGSYAFLGDLSGAQAAIDGRWAAIFLANFHFAAEGTNYLASQQLPSPLQNFWTLSVEEQFYLVYPTLFLIIAALRTRISMRARLAIVLAVVIVASFALSVSQTSSNPTVAYFSPFTRAWELALGALVAVGTSWLLRLRAHIAAAMTWLGLGAILAAAVIFNSVTAYPGSLVAIPVVGAAFIIAGGVVAPRHGVEALLRLAPFAWLGNLSYSLYLWHWPILIIVAEHEQKTSLSFVQNIPWLILALVASVASYALVENPIRHATFPTRYRWASVAGGVGLIALTLTLVIAVFPSESAPASPGATDRVAAGTNAEVARLVAASTEIQRLPAHLTPSLQAASQDFGAPPGLCTPAVGAASVPSCSFGDPNGRHTMVLYGDSHALMWFTAMDDIAIQAHWRLVILGKGYCMANKYPAAATAYPLLRKCSHWQEFATQRIKQLDPDLVVVTQEYQNSIDKVPYTPAQWQQGLETTLNEIAGPHTKFVVLGNIPQADPDPPNCLAEHPDQVQLCSGPLPNQIYNEAEKRAVTAEGGRYISVTPWFCSQRCSAVVGRFQLYVNQLHVTASYSLFLRHVLAEKLDLSRYQ
jgi:peptidoglycan/LPS O-acetylase OafA/YrhL